MRFVFVALSKDEIRRLQGGRVFGSRLLLEVELGPFARCWVFGRLRNQYRTQRSPRHPEGWEPITADGFGQELKYDLATGTLELPVPVVGTGGVVGFFWRRCPARIYRYSDQDDNALLKRREARVWRARFQLLRAIKNHWSDAREVGKLMTESLGIPWRDQTGDALATRLIMYAYALDENTCRDLTGALTVASQSLRLAA